MKEFVVTQPYPKALPVLDAYLACTRDGCPARFYLPRHQKLRSLGIHAERAGWFVDRFGGEACPDHRPAQQLPPVAACPTDTVIDSPRPPHYDPLGYPARPATEMPRRPHDGTYTPPRDTQNGDAR